MRIIGPSENSRDLGHVPQLFRKAFVAQALLPVRDVCDVRESHDSLSFRHPELRRAFSSARE